MTSTRAPSVLLYDGMCGFCDRTIQFIVQRDHRRTMQFAALQGDFAAQLFAQFPALRAIDSVVFVQPDSVGPAPRVSVRSDAVIAIAQYLGGVWIAAAWMLRVIPRPVRDWGYDALAKRRFRVFGRLDACRIPSADERARFLD